METYTQIMEKAGDEILSIFDPEDRFGGFTKVCYVPMSVLNICLSDCKIAMFPMMDRLIDFFNTAGNTVGVAFDGLQRSHHYCIGVCLYHHHRNCFHESWYPRPGPLPH